MYDIYNLAEDALNGPGPVEVIVKYNDDIRRLERELNAEVEILSENYAIITLSSLYLERLAAYREIEDIEKPKQLLLNFNDSLEKSCVPAFQYNTESLTGKGVLVGIIDSGIDYAHSDFIDDAGDSRVLFFWDQTYGGNPPDGFKSGYEYTGEQLSAALRAPRAQAAHTGRGLSWARNRRRGDRGRKRKGVRTRGCGARGVSHCREAGQKRLPLLCRNNRNYESYKVYGREGDLIKYAAGGKHKLRHQRRGA
jgi:hypothetical protein